MPTTDDLLDLKVSQRQSWFRFDLWNKDQVKIGELHPDTEATPTIENSINREVKRQLSNIVIPPSEWPDINLVSDRLRPVMVLENDDVRSLGEFLFSDTTREQATRGSWLHCNTMLDQGYLLNQDIEGTYGFSPGYLISDAFALFALDRSRGIRNWNIGDSDAVIGPNGVTWPVGTKFLKVLTDLGRLAGFASPWFDNNGWGQLQPYANIDAWTDLRYSQSLGNIVANSVAESDNMIDAPNRYIVISNDASNSSYVGVYDVPDENPISFASRGFRVTQTTDAQGITSGEQAIEMARNQANGSPNVLKNVTFNGIVDPRHDTFQVLNYEGLNYREYNWSMPLVEGADMVHNIHAGGTWAIEEEQNAA